MPALAAVIPLGNVNNPATGEKFGEANVGIEKLVSNLIGVGTIVAGIILVGYFIFGAVQWSAAGGDKAQIDTAKKTITNAVIGMVLVAAGMIVVSIIETILGVSITRPDWTKVTVL